MLSRSVRFLITTTRAALPRSLVFPSPSRFLISPSLNSSSRLQAFESSTPEQSEDVLKAIRKLLTEEREARRNEIEARLLRQLDEVRTVVGELSKELREGLLDTFDQKLVEHTASVKDLLRRMEGRILYPDTGGEPVWLDGFALASSEFGSKEQQEMWDNELVPMLLHEMKLLGDARNRKRLRDFIGEPWKEKRKRLGYKRKERRRAFNRNSITYLSLRPPLFPLDSFQESSPLFTEPKPTVRTSFQFLSNHKVLIRQTLLQASVVG
ncbi:hypothetical protein JCM8097_009389 [Rhodosporidiobolus ruineniae]